MSPNRSTPDARFPLALFYAAYFANMGILLPFLPPWLRDQGLAPTAIGVVLAVQPLAKMAAPWTWGRWADARGERRWLLVGALAVAAVALATLGRVQPAGLGALLAIVGVYAFATAPALPYAEATALEQAERRGFAYGRVRLWGSIAFILAAGGFGVVLERVGTPAGFLVGAGLLVAAALGVAAWPPAERARREHRPSDGAARSGIAGSTARLFAACALMQASHGAYYAFYSIRLRDLGYGGTAIGALWALGVISEVALLARADHLVARWGSGTVLRAALVAAAVRWIVIARVASAAPLIAAQTLHALTYAAFHVAALREIHRRFAVGRRATGQALYSGLTYGLGTLAGTLLAGRLVDVLDVPGAFLVSSGLAVGGLVVLGRTTRQR